MGKKSEHETALTGYDPKQFGRMTMLFVCLSLVNVAAVLFAFYRTGFGLYHAEKGLSHISKITQCVLSISESSQDILLNLNSEDTEDKILEIEVAFSTIDAESAEYRSVDLTEVDDGLGRRFEDAYMDTQRYQSVLHDFTEAIRDGRMNSEDQIHIEYTLKIEPQKTKAEESMNSLFDDQIKATYDFFVRAAQQFLFVLLFLFITMTVGIIGIQRMRKNSRRAAEVLAQEQEHAERLREKTFDIAYLNILTGFRNFYGLENDLGGKIRKSEFTAFLCGFNDFEQLWQICGRDRADEFITLVSHELSERFADTAEVYSTDTDEFFFLIYRKCEQEEIDRLMQEIMAIMSANYMIGGEAVHRSVSGCYYVCTPGKKQSVSQLFFTMDRAISVARAQSAQNGQNASVHAGSVA